MAIMAHNNTQILFKIRNLHEKLSLGEYEGTYFGSSCAASQDFTKAMFFFWIFASLIVTPPSVHGNMPPATGRPR
jgi:hypothetical protein